MTTMMNTRPKEIGSIVTSYEKVIRQNRDYGYDRDILGKKSVQSSPFSRQRRASISCGHVKAPRRVSLATTRSSSLALMAEPPKILEPKESSPPPPLSYSNMSPKKEAKQKTSSSTTTKHTAVKKTTTAPVQQPLKAPKKATDDDECEEDDELKAWKERINGLQTKLQQVRDKETAQLETIQADKKAKTIRMRLQKRQSQKLFRNIGGRSSLEKQAKKQQHEIEQLRQGNKQLRQESREMAFSIQHFKKENDQLNRVQSTTQLYYDKLSNFHTSEEGVHRRYSNALPKFRIKLSELDMEGEQRLAWIHVEKRIRTNYHKCQEQIIHMLQDRCNDKDLVDQVLRLSLGLEG